MELNFYTLCVIYLVYSFLGWVAETVVATIKGRAFVNRGVASGPFCFVYGTAAVLMAVGFTGLRSTPVALFLGCAANATVVEWVTAKLLERMHRRRWWDYSDKKFNLDGYVCLQYSVLWGLLGMASVLWGNVLLLRLCALLPGWLLHIGVWAAMTLAVLDQLGAALAVNRYAASHPRLEQLNLELEKHSDKLRQRLIAHVEKRIQRAYPAIVQPEPTVQKEKALSFGDLVWLFVIGAFLGDVVETLFCRVTAGVWMSRSSLVWGPFSVVWGLALVMAAVLLGLQRLQVQSGRPCQPALLLLLGHRGGGLDPVRLPPRRKADGKPEKAHPALDDRGADGVHGREHGAFGTGAGPVRRPHQRPRPGEPAGRLPRRAL